MCSHENTADYKGQRWIYVKIKPWCQSLAYLHIPEPQLGAVVRSTGDQVDVVGTPGQVGDTVRMTLQGPQQLQLVALLQH